MTRPLTAVQREVLEALIKLYEKHRRMIKSKEVAKILGKDEGTIRNIIMILKNMGLVESRTGPAGGYVPSLKAYEVLGSPTVVSIGGYGIMIVYRDGGEMKLSVINLELLGLLSIEPARAVARIAGNLAGVEPGHRVRIESTGARRIVIEGKVVKADVNAGEVLISIEKMAVLPDVKVGYIAKKNLITIRDDETVRNAAKILYEHGIRGAPVVDSDSKVVGFITTTDVAMVVANYEDLDAPVSRYMRRNVISIDQNESIIEAMRLMDFHGVGRLLVVNTKKEPVGIVTRTDILRYILALK